MISNRLNEAVIGSAKVIVDILPAGKVIPNAKMTPTSITIHNTGNIGAIAKNNHNYMKNCNKTGERKASWHFTVDDKEIYQAQSTNYKCWHAGNATGNNTSIGIEICMFNDAAKQKKCYENAIALVKILMQYHGFGIDQVKRHKDWSGKHCPAWLIEGKFGYTWDWFKNQISGSTTAPKPIEKTPSAGSFTVKIKVDLNVRKGPGTSFGIATTVKPGDVFTIVETNGSWGKLKSGAGWINISSSYVTKQ
jgi:N-acetylmuramoyl-L-alanine amidase CwlA